MEKTRIAEFNFVVEGLTEKQIESLLDLICTYLDSHNSIMGGGFSFLDKEEVEDKKEPENGKA